MTQRNFLATQSGNNDEYSSTDSGSSTECLAQSERRLAKRGGEVYRTEAGSMERSLGSGRPH